MKLIDVRYRLEYAAIMIPYVLIRLLPRRVLRLPAAGTVGVFFGGWYGAAIRMFCTGDMSEMEFCTRMHHYRGLEESLAASGMAIAKIWLHLDKKEHAERLKKRLEHKQVRHFTPYDKKASENYDALASAASRASGRETGN